MKKTAFEILQKKSNDAVSAIRTTIDQLKSANADIEKETQKNEQSITYLQNTNAALSGLHGDNARVISNFEALLGSN